MSKFIERFKARHTSDGVPQKYDHVRNPHNVDLIGDDDSKEAKDIPAKQTKKVAVKTNYKKENTTTATRGKI